MADTVPNVISELASPEMRWVWSPTAKVLLEREFWIAILKAQRDLGLPVPGGCIEAYERVKHVMDFDSMRRRELVTRHDVKARIEEFCALAGHEQIHKGMTSYDLVGNVEQMQIYRGLQLIAFKVGHHPGLDAVIASYPARGLKGAVGTGLDQITLFGGDVEKARELERRVLAYLGLPCSLNAIGQVYPRSLDFKVVSVLADCVNSSPFSGAYRALMAGYLSMASSLAGDQWNEGDVSCSVVRRVMLANAFFTADAVVSHD